MGKTKRGKGTKLMALWQRDRSGLPLSPCARGECFAPHEEEVTLVEATLPGGELSGRGARVLIGDREPTTTPTRSLGAALRERGIEMIAPHCRNRKKPK